MLDEGSLLRLACRTGAGAGSKPARREDVLMLQSWLQEMMVQALAQVATSRPGATAAEGGGEGGAGPLDAAAAVADKVGGL